jgi:two-component system response regulator NreC
MTHSKKEAPATVLIADDHGVLRAGLRAMFAGYPFLKVVGDTEGHETIRLAQQLLPDMVLLDVEMREMDGIAVIQALGRALPATRVLILTAATDLELLRSALRAGACGYVAKSASEVELMSAIEAVLRGDLYLDPTVTRSLLVAEASPHARSETSPLDALTTRELEVMRLVANGYTNRQIARYLVLSVRTVECHRANLIHKLGMPRRNDLVRMVNDFQLERASGTGVGYSP